MAHDIQADASSEGPKIGSAPSIALPKGGGAIRGIGEKFAANPVTGTGSLSVPVVASPGRSGFGPQLSLTYDSGAGNGPFGFGWSLSLPQITRKTEKGLPQYNDAEESDVFILSGSEDLVPVFKTKPDGTWLRDAKGNLIVDDSPRGVFTVRAYRPRIEGLFARIERWTRDNGEVHWCSISKDNILTLYGADANSRIADPVDPRRVFTWLICETRDDKGNAILYKYKSEDGTGADLTRAHQRNRGDPNDPRRATNRYLKRILYGNRVSLLDSAGIRPRELTNAQRQNPGWMFELVLDYGDHDQATPKPRDDEEKNAAGILKRPWAYRQDPFSGYRSGFELRTTRLCQRVLMFHHFPGEAEVGSDCLVRSTDFTYSHQQDPLSARNPVYTFLTAVTQTGYRRKGARYETRSLPPVTFEYTQPIVQDTVEDVDAASLENLPIGVDGTSYQWTDLHGEGIPGILTEQAGAWFYKRNISPISKRPVEFAPLERVATKSNFAAGQAQFMDLAGDGQPDLVVLDAPMPGLHEHDGEEGWKPFRPFTSRLNRDMRDPNLKFIDLDGDGHGDVMITEDDAFVWHPSLAEAGFGPARRVAQGLDEEKGPRLVFADGSESIYLADLSGDGLTDLVRIRNGEVCYWPNLGYGRFGAKISMDHAPEFDSADQFDQKRVRLADIDGSGTTDIIYLHRDGVRLFFNQSGNGWSAAQTLKVFPRVDDLLLITPADLRGNGTACLVWSSPLPGDARRAMRYVSLMGEQKPHLLFRTINNLGAETVVEYAPSTKFYLQDKRDGHAWITRLPFPVHVVERVETWDHVSRNRFVTRYAYHHGYFDGEEREFRGFGMVEQRDTAEFAALSDGTLPAATNVDASSHVPAVLTKTWFHTGVHLGRDHVLRGVFDDVRAGASSLDETVLPAGLTLEEEREAHRSLKGAMLRQEVYGLDRSAEEPYPYIVTEQSFTVRAVQPRATNRHAVFFTQTREAINFHYERIPADPRIQHALTLEVDAYGNVLKEAAIGYGRRATIRVLDAQGRVQQVVNPGLNALAVTDQEQQLRVLATYSEHRFTKPVESAESHRNPLPCETRTFELTGYPRTGLADRFQPSDLVEADPNLVERLRHVFLGETDYEKTAAGPKRRRLIELTRTLYRKNDLTGLCALGELEGLALPGESYKLAFTPGLLSEVYQRRLAGQPLRRLIPDPDAVLAGQARDRGGYVQSQALKADGRFPNTDADDHWWIPSGRSFFTSNPNDSAATELTAARHDFFLPQRYRDPFGQDGHIRFDAHKLLTVESRDALDNQIAVESNDYRVLQPRVVSDPNRNRMEVAFDALGLVVGTFVMGKPAPAAEGDSAVGFTADLTQLQIDTFHDSADLHASAPALLQKATTRIVYDLDRFERSRRQHPQDPTRWLPAYAATLARETHASDLLPPNGLKIQISFSYSDGFGREIQKKIQAEPGPLVPGGPVVPLRWVGSGWTIFNNKGKVVRQYEPFFSQLPAKRHQFEFGVQVGVSPILFYDPVERVVATLHPNHTYEKVVFDPWRQITWDVNDTVLGDPRTDADIRGYIAGYFANLPASPPAAAWETWHTQRQGAARGAQEQSAADKAAAHANTPTTAHFDTLGRPFLTVAHNGFNSDTTPIHFSTRVELDIEGNQRAVRDAIEQAGEKQGRIVMRYAYDMLGNRIHHQSMEAGGRWMLNDSAGKTIRAWDSRGHTFRTEYDPLRRPLRSQVTGADPANPDKELLAERLVYGEQHPQAELLNLRGRLYLHLDQAGVVASEAHDFKGNLLRASRRLTSGTQYRQAIDWSAVDADHVALPADAKAALDPVALSTALAARVEADTYVSATTYDALNRMVTLTTPHTTGMQPSTIRPGYNDANLLERVDANLRSATVNGQPVWTPFVTNIDYDAKGQRQRIDYATEDGRLISTRYTYDRETFRLTHLYTRRGVDPQTRGGVTFPGDCDNPQPPPPRIAAPDVAPPDSFCGLQNLHYTYDPVGNITHIRDVAQQTIYFDNKRVEPSADYTYDAIYRLIEAAGREHLGQGNAPIPHSHDDALRTRLRHPGDGDAMGTYVERYVYDAVGNFMEMSHRGSDPVRQGWTRTYAYGETSLIEDGTGGTLAKTSNRLRSTTVGTNNPSVERYVYDAHGNMVRMPHLAGTHPAPNMHWDHRDQLRRTDLGGGGTAYYVYDAAGQRVRKVWEKSATLVEERIYLGSFEIYRRQNGAERLARETLHVMDDKQRIALVETRTLDTAGTDSAPRQLTRYQLGNHLGSASLELDDQADVISYEEYTPYGSTSYQAVRSQTTTPKRYCYTGKERDEESGLCFYGARYYAPHLCRWIAVDPSGVGPSVNVYTYVSNRPITLIDPDGREEATAEEWSLSSKPGLGESLIPVWGSARDASHNFSKGNWGWGIAYTALAITDVFLVKALVTAVAKGIGKAGAKLAARELAAKELAAKELAAKELAAKELAAKELAAKELAAKELAAKELAAKQLAKEAAAKTAGVSFTRSQLQHAFKHAKDFGITGNQSNKTLAEFVAAIEKHVADAGTRAIEGTYRGIKGTVTHFVNPVTGLNVIRDASGQLVSAWKLSAAQLKHVLTTGKLGGGL